MKSQNIIGNNQLAPPHFGLINSYTNSDGYIIIHFEKMSLSGILDYIYFEKDLDDIADEQSTRAISDEL